VRFSRIWRRAANARHFDEEGFTLIELTISIVILVIVIGAITLALMTVLMLSGGASKSISDSADAQVVSASLTNDVQSAVGITTAPTVSKCGPATAIQLLGLEWNRVPGSSPTTFNPQASSGKVNFDTVVSYLAVRRGSTWVLVRDQCTSGAAGYSSTPSSSENVSSDICGPSEAGCTAQQPPTITPTTKAGPASAGWTSASGVIAASFTIAEPKSHYSYTLAADPAAAGSSSTVTTVVPTSTGCQYATPDTGTYANSLCFVTFQSYKYATAKYTAGNPASCQTITESITGTPFKLSFCLTVQAGTESNDEAPPTGWSSACRNTPGYVQTPVGVSKPANPPANPCADPSSADVVASSLPTYANPPTSEAFLGNNGFYTGVPGDPALYEYLEGTAATLYFTHIKVSGPSGAATNWSLVTGDAESTDPGESLTWSTCTSKNGAVQTSCTGSPTPPRFNLVPNKPPGDAYGDACMNTKYTNTTTSWLRYGALAPNDKFPATTHASKVFEPTVSTQAQEVECVAGVTSDKTGTVMLEASDPSNLTVNMVGTGLQAVFFGFLLG
jgi:hypothetical protein